MAPAFSERELVELDAHLEAVAQQELRRLEQALGHAFSCRLLLRGLAGPEIEIYARNIALAS
jgi:hypothetical protein